MCVNRVMQVHHWRLRWAPVPPRPAIARGDHCLRHPGRAGHGQQHRHSEAVAPRRAHVAAWHPRQRASAIPASDPVLCGDDLALLSCPWFQVVVGDQVLMSKGFGTTHVDYTGTAPVTGDSIFRIGSNTKPFITLAYHKLVEMGVVGAHDALSTHLPEVRVFCARCALAWQVVVRRSSYVCRDLHSLVRVPRPVCQQRSHHAA